jgi:hypothetical protein
MGVVAGASSASSTKQERMLGQARAEGRLEATLEDLRCFWLEWVVVSVTVQQGSRTFADSRRRWSAEPNDSQS